MKNLIAFRTPGFLNSLIVIAVLLGMAQTAFAVPAAPITHILEQPDGTKFKARLWGDEWNHGWETTKGYTILKDESTKAWFYAVEKDGSLAPSNSKVGKSAPPGVPKHIRGKKVGINSGSHKVEGLSFSPGNGGPQKSSTISQSMPSTGTVNLPVILINFNDTSTTYAATDFENLLFGNNPAIASGPGSMKDYYEEASYGQLTISSGSEGVTGWFTANYEHDIYGEPDELGAYLVL